MQYGNVHAMQSPRGKIGDHIVVKDRREKSAAEKLCERDMCNAERCNAVLNHRLELVEETRLGQQGNREKKRKKKIVLGKLVLGFAQRQRAHLRDIDNTQ